jgi:hypothetical protein
VTRFTVQRTGPAWMPVTVQAGDARRRLTSRARQQTVTLVSSERPAAVVVDPAWVLVDPDRSNNTFSLP